MLEKWTHNLGELKKPLSEDCYICEDHFCNEDIVRCDETILVDGSTYRSQRTIPKLKETAVPLTRQETNDQRTEHNDSASLKASENTEDASTMQSLNISTENEVHDYGKIFI